MKEIRRMNSDWPGSDWPVTDADVVSSLRRMRRETRPLMAAFPINCTTLWWEAFSTQWLSTYIISSPVRKRPSISADPPGTIWPTDTYNKTKPLVKLVGWINWFYWHVNLSGVILCQEVRKSHMFIFTFYV